MKAGKISTILGLTATSMAIYPILPIELEHTASNASDLIALESRAGEPRCCMGDVDNQVLSGEASHVMIVMHEGVFFLLVPLEGLSIMTPNIDSDVERNDKTTNDVYFTNRKSHRNWF